MRHSRHHWHAPTLSFALLLGACSTRPEQTSALPDDLKKDLAIAATSGGDLAIAPQRYHRMRFVSGAEQIPSAAPARRPTAVHHAAHRAPIHHAAPAARVASVDAAPEPANDAAPAPAPAPTTVADSPTPEPAPAAHGSAGEPGRGPSEGVGDRGQGGGLAGILGGIIGAVVIRGGIGGVDHCDPRTDGRRGRPTSTGEGPVFGEPAPMGRVIGRGGIRF